MTVLDPDGSAALVASIHPPWRGSLAACLSRWAVLDAAEREGAYLVLELGGEQRRTLNAAAIADLALGQAAR
jgi:hypothetical protein